MLGRITAITAASQARRLATRQPFTTRSFKLEIICHSNKLGRTSFRFYSTAPPQKDAHAEANKQEEKETKDTNENAQEKVPEEDPLEKEVEQPEWRSQRKRTTFRPKTEEQAEGETFKISRNNARIYAGVGALIIGVSIFGIYNSIVPQFKDGYTDTQLIIRDVLEKAFTIVNEDSTVRDYMGAFIVDDPMISFNVFGDRMTVLFPLIQLSSHTRGGTVYVDMQRVGDYYELAHSYVDFVDGHSFDFAHLISPPEKPYRLHFHDKKYSQEESMRLAQEEQRRQMEDLEKQRKMKEQGNQTLFGRRASA